MRHLKKIAMLLVIALLVTLIPANTAQAEERPNAPDSVSVIVEANKVKLEWTEVSDVKKYGVQRREFDGTSWSSWTALSNYTKKNYYSDETVVEGVTYQYRVKAANSAGWGAYITTDSVILGNQIGAPESISASILPEGTGVSIEWSAVDNALRYGLYRCVNDENAWGEWTEISTELTAVNYVDTNIVDGKSYRYRVNAWDANGCGYFSASAEVTLAAAVVATTTPGISKTITVSAGTDSITVEWTPVDSATQYGLYRRVKTNDAWGGWKTVSSTLNSTYYIDANVSEGVIYQYRVRAYNSAGWSNKYRASSDVTLLKSLAAPAYVTAAAFKDKISIEWSEVAEAKGYNLYKRVSDGTVWGEWNELVSNIVSSEYVDIDIESGKLYQYRVQTVSAAGNGGSCESVEVIVPLEIKAPETITATADSASVTVQWSAVDNALKYGLYRSVYDGNAWGEWTEISTSLMTVNYVDTDVVAGKNYRYKVNAWDANGCSDFSAYAEATITAVKKPSAPKTITVSAETDRITVEWSSVENASKYGIYRRVKTDGVWSSWKTINSSLYSTFYIDANVLEGGTYQYRVRAYNSAGWGSYKLTSEVTVLARPAAPEMITAIASSDDIYIGWSEVDDATAYNLYRRVSDGAGWSEWGIIYTDGSETEYTDKDVAVGNKYQYKVQAVNDAGKGNFCESGEVGIAQKPSEPLGVTVATEAGKVVIEWNAVSDALRYCVEYKEFDEETLDSWTRLSSSVYDTSFVFDDATAGTQYQFRVKAYNLAGWGEYETSAPVVVPAKPGAPRSVSVFQENGSVSIIWNSVDDAVRYSIERREYNGDTWDSWSPVSRTVTDTTYVDSDVNFGSQYQYRVRALNEAGWGNSCTTETISVSFQVANSIVIDESIFPDENFRKYVSDDFDLNHDGLLSRGEMLAVDYIYIDTNNEVLSLKGIEYFTGLRSLQIYSTDINYLDLSHNVLLSTLYCYDCQLTQLDLSHNELLSDLTCDNCQLTQLDLSHNGLLSDLTCNNCQLTQLDLSHNELLNNVDCQGNKLTSLTLGNNPLLKSLYCQNNMLTTLDVSGCSREIIVHADADVVLTPDDLPVHLNCNSRIVFVSESVQIEIYNASNRNIRIESEDDTIATITKENGYYFIKGLKRGTTSVIVKDDNGELGRADILVADLQITADGKDLVKNAEGKYAISVNKGEKVQLGAYVEYPDGYEELRTSSTRFVPSNGIQYVSINSTGMLTAKSDAVAKQVIRVSGGIGRVYLNDHYYYRSGNYDAITVYVNSPMPTPAITVDEMHFPDEIFREYVVNNFDKDSDGSLSKAEIDAVTEISISGKQELKSLKGIEYFVNLTSLDCSYSNLTELDVSKNTKLSDLECMDCPVASLNLKGLTDLKRLICWEASIKELDVSGLESLEYIGCGESRVKVINAAGATALKTLLCPDTGLTSIDLTGATSLEVLDCSTRNQLTSLDVSTNKSLKTLYISGNNLEKLDVSNNSELTWLDCIGNGLTELILNGATSLEHINCDGNNLSTLDFSSCGSVVSVTCSENEITVINASGNPKLNYLDCTNNPQLIIYMVNNDSKCEIKADKDETTVIWEVQEGIPVDESHFPDETFRDYIAGNLDGNHDNILSKDEIQNITSIDVGCWYIITDLSGIQYFTSLETLNCCNNNVKSLDLTGLTKLTTLDCQDNLLSALDLSDCPNLKSLDCGRNSIRDFSAVKFADSTKLEILCCSNNWMTKLDVSSLTGLKVLDCSINELTSLDVSNCKKLDVLYCHTNELTSLNVSGCTELSEIQCDHNKLTTLDVSGCSSECEVNADSTVTIIRENVGVTEIPIDEIHFPDSNFRNYVLSDIDRNRDGVLSVGETHVTHLFVSNKNIGDLTGVEYFPEIVQLNCWNNHLTTLDLSKNIALRYLYCENNQLTQLDLSKNISLSNLNCSGNQLEELDLSKNTSLYYINCYNNNIEQLDVSHCMTSCDVVADDDVIVTPEREWSLSVTERYTNVGNYNDFEVYNGSGNYISFSTENSNVAYVSEDRMVDGRYRLYPVSCGIANIIATDKNGNEQTIRVIVIDHEITATNAEIEKDTSGQYSYIVTMKPGTSATLSMEFDIPEGLDYTFTPAWDDSIYEGYTHENYTINNNGVITVASDFDGVLYHNYYCARGSLGNDGKARWISLGRLKIVVTDAESVEINEITFPDEVFREYVVKNFDKDSDGSLSKAEKDAVTEIRIEGKEELESLKGIEYFVNLTSLNCPWNNLTELDVSKNTKLSYLNCEYNPVASLNLKGLMYLKELRCWETSIKELDVSGLESLEYIDCAESGVKVINAAGATALKRLVCNQTGLTGIDLTGATSLEVLECWGTNLITLDVSTNTNLTTLNCYNSHLEKLLLNDNLVYLDCRENQLSSLDLSGRTELVTVYCQANKMKEIKTDGAISLAYLECISNQLTSLDISTNNSLETLYITDNNLEKLDVSNNSKLTSLECDHNKLTELILNGATALGYLNCCENSLSTLDFSSCGSVVSVSCSENEITVINASGNPKLNYLDCTNNPQLIIYMVNNDSKCEIKTDKDEATVIWEVQEGIPVDESHFPDDVFRDYVSANCDEDRDGYLSRREISARTIINVYNMDISDLTGIGFFTYLRRLNCVDNQLTALDVSGNTALETLTCDLNKLTELDVSGNTALETLSCGSNQLTALDVSGATALQGLSCFDNKLTELDVSGAKALQRLNCNNNQLTELDVSENIALLSLSCGDNQLTELDISGNTALQSLYCAWNQLTELGVSESNLADLDCRANYLTSLNVSGCSYLQKLLCYWNRLTSIDVSTCFSTIDVDADDGVEIIR